MNEDLLIDLLVEAILDDICRRTDEWADPTGEKAIELCEMTSRNETAG